MPSTGNQVPTWSWCGSYTRTEGPFAAKMADVYGMPPLPWQRTVLNDWLALGDDGKLLNSLCALAVPRQCGKTGVCDPRETWGLLHRGEQILHTAQEYQTARKAFDRLRKKFGECRNDPMARFPELNRKVDRYTTSANQMILDLTNGGHIEFRTRGSNPDVGRGQTYDLVVVDEAQAYTDEQDAAISPLNVAAPSGSPQTILMGTVPDPRKPYKGEKWAAIRAAAHSDPYDGMCMHEWGVGEIGDVRDVSRWYEANPSLGYHLLLAGLEKDSRSMSPDTFAREHLGWWPPMEVLADRPIGAAEWKRCATQAPPMEGVKCFAVKFSPDGAEGVLAACIRPRGGVPHVELVDVRHMSDGLAPFVAFAASVKDKAAQIVVDGQSNAQALEERLLAEHVPKRALIRPRPSDMTAACASFVAAVRECQVTHFDQETLTAAAVGCRKRRIGHSGGWGFQSTDEADATVAEAAALAYWACMNTRRDPDRKAVLL